MTVHSIWLFLIATSFARADQYPQSEQVHIGYAEGNKLSVSWVTLTPYSDNTQPILYVSEKANDIPSSANITYGYTQSLPMMSHYYHHTSTLDLTPGTVYYYQPGQNASIYSFIAPDRDSTTKKSISFIAFADQGIKGTDTADLINNMVNDQHSNIDFVMHIGDIGYADVSEKELNDADYMQVWDQWGELMEPVMSVVPYQVSPGNHENSCHDSAEFGCAPEIRNFSVYRNYFSMPQVTEPVKYGHSRVSSESSNVNPGKYNLWYSYEVGNLHVLSVNTESGYTGSPCEQSRLNPQSDYPKCGPFGDQSSFVRDDLAQAAANSDIDWIIVVGHRPPYSSFESDNNWPPETPDYLRKFLEPLFHEYGVDLYIDGHVHAYERDYPIYQGKATQKNYDHPSATVYITCGAGHSVEGHSANHTPKDYSAFIDDENWGIGKVFIPNSTHLNWQYITATHGQIEDEIWIVKQA